YRCPKDPVGGPGLSGLRFLAKAPAFPEPGMHPSGGAKRFQCRCIGPARIPDDKGCSRCPSATPVGIAAVELDRGWPQGQFDGAFPRVQDDSADRRSAGSLDLTTDGDYAWTKFR